MIWKSQNLRSIKIECNWSFRNNGMIMKWVLERILMPNDQIQNSISSDLFRDQIRTNLKCQVNQLYGGI